MIKNSFEYKTIKKFYGKRRAARSGVLLMNHIDEGLYILSALGARDEAKLAFCIHPIVQMNEEVDVTGSSVFGLAKEYSNQANAYLCTPETDWISTPEQLMDHLPAMSLDCINMLIADKLQNKKDFIAYHRGTHKRSIELDRYFDIWLSYLFKLKTQKAHLRCVSLVGHSDQPHR